MGVDNWPGEWGERSARWAMRWCSGAYYSQGAWHLIGLPYGMQLRWALALATARVRRLPTVKDEGGQIQLVRQESICLTREINGTLRTAGKGKGRRVAGGRRSGAVALRRQLRHLLWADVHLDVRAESSFFEAPEFEPGRKLKRGPGSQSVGPAAAREDWRHGEEDAFRTTWTPNRQFVADAKQHSKPVDLRTMRAFGKDILGWDTFMFLNYRAQVLKEPQEISYEDILTQQGVRWDTKEQFRARKAHLKQLIQGKVLYVHPELKVRRNKHSLKIFPSPPQFGVWKAGP